MSYLLRAILQPVENLFKTAQLFDFRITRPLACPHQHERTACLSEHAVQHPPRNDLLGK
jgi:hypothetical protein